MRNFFKNCFDFSDLESDTIENKTIINPKSYSSKSYAFEVFSDCEVTLLGEGKDEPFVHFSNVFCF